MDAGQVAARADRQQLARRWRQNGSHDLFVCPPAIADYLGEYVHVRGGPTDTVVDLWAGSGILLPAVTEVLRPSQALAVVADERPLLVADALHPDVEIQWWEGSPSAFLDATSHSMDVVLGVPPWGWRPRDTTVESGHGPIHLTEDPSIAVVLRACTRLTVDGVGLFVLSPGFLMRPGPGTAMAKLGELGIHVESITGLPRGMFSPDSGTGRVLVAFSRRPMPEVLVGSLRPDGGERGGLLGRLAEQRRP